VRKRIRAGGVKNGSLEGAAWPSFFSRKGFVASSDLPEPPLSAFPGHFPVPGDGEAEGRTRQVFCMEVDVTARKELEESLRQAGQVFDHARDAILVVDREHRVLAVNHAYTELTGYPADEVVGAELPSLRLGGRSAPSTTACATTSTATSPGRARCGASAATAPGCRSARPCRRSPTRTGR
jgi:PAS domain-containing protein